ncbi:hypothetical protein ACTXT7_003225 [Hymenolepis weldensis]
MQVYPSIVCHTPEVALTKLCAAHVRLALPRAIATANYVARSQFGFLIGPLRAQSYASLWSSKINYCDSASELFNLLFHNGVGTLNTEFYLAWTEHLKQLPERPSDTQAKLWARIASIFAHGLRAGAKPHYLLEDRAEQVMYQLILYKFASVWINGVVIPAAVTNQERCEPEYRCFVASVKRSERLAEEKRGFEKLISDQQRKERAEDERQTLSELRTVESGDGGPIVPKVRTGAAINPERQGLRSLRPYLQDVPVQQKPRPGLQILHDPAAPSDLPDLASVQPISGSAIALGKTLSRLTEPVASWNVENVKSPSVRFLKNGEYTHWLTEKEGIAVEAIVHQKSECSQGR